MAKSLKAEKAITLANKCDELEEAVIIGVDYDGGLQLFTSDVNREHMVVILERAKLKLLTTIGQEAVKSKGTSKRKQNVVGIC